METIFLVYIIYNVTKILRKYMRPLLRRNYGKLRVWGMSAWEGQRRFRLVFVAQPFTRSLPTRIQ